MRTFKHTTLAVLAASMGLAGSAMAQTAEVIHWWTAGGESAAVQELAAAYKAAGGTWVDTAIAGGDNARNTTLNRIAGGKPPTVAQFNTSKQYHEVVAEGLLNDIDAVAVKEGWDKIFPEPLKKFVKINGKYFAMPVNIHNPSWFWYSKAVLAKAGVTAEPHKHGPVLCRAGQDQGLGRHSLGLGWPGLARRHHVQRRAAHRRWC